MIYIENPDVLIISPHIHHDVPPHASWYPSDVLNIPNVLKVSATFDLVIIAPDAGQWNMAVKSYLPQLLKNKLMQCLWSTRWIYQVVIISTLEDTLSPDTTAVLPVIITDGRILHQICFKLASIFIRCLFCDVSSLLETWKC